MTPDAAQAKVLLVNDSQLDGFECTNSAPPSQCGPSQVSSADSAEQGLLLQNSCELAPRPFEVSLFIGAEPVQQSPQKMRETLHVGVADLQAAKALLDRNPSPSEEEIRFALAGNLCRCTGYDKIVRAVDAAAKDVKKQQVRAKKAKARKVGK